MKKHFLLCLAAVFALNHCVFAQEEMPDLPDAAAPSPAPAPAPAEKKATADDSDNPYAEQHKAIQNAEKAVNAAKRRSDRRRAVAELRKEVEKLERIYKRNVEELKQQEKSFANHIRLARSKSQKAAVQKKLKKVRADIKAEQEKAGYKKWYDKVKELDNSKKKESKEKKVRNKRKKK